jgi:hypothetical protein
LIAFPSATGRHGANPKQGWGVSGRPIAQSDIDLARKGLAHPPDHDQGQVLLVNLAKGHIGEDSSSLLGGLLVTTIGLAAFSRAETPPAERRDFFVYIDEFQSFTTLALANMLSELRKYRVGFTVAHQYLNQLEPDVRHARPRQCRVDHLVPGWRRRCPVSRP